MEFAHLLGRILFGGYFVYNGLNHLVFGTEMLTGYASSKGVESPRTMVYLSGVLLLLGGLSLLLGVWPNWGILLLLVFLITVSFAMHAFWKEAQEARAADMINFTKNMALVGALLMFYAIPRPWPLSIEG
ncbi:MAG: DoxX family membrane protein [Gemmatimonadota bacterium]